MASFKNFERKAGHIAGKALDKGSELLKSGKMKLLVGKEEHAIEELYYQIGKVVYDHYEDKSEVPVYLADLFEKIAEHRERIIILEASAEAEDCDDDVDEFIVDITEESEESEKQEEAKESE